MRKLSLVPDWKNIWKWWSAQITTVATGIVLVAPVLDRYLQEEKIFYIVGGILILALIARVIEQPKLEKVNVFKRRRSTDLVDKD